MPALAHVILHLTFCSAMMHAPSGTPMDVHLHARDHTDRQTFDRALSFTSGGESSSQTAEFDAPRGVFLMTLNAPKYNCGAASYQVFIEGESRNMKATLTAGNPQPWGGWPYTLQFNLPEDILDNLATQPKNVLLCPKIYETSAG